MKTIIIKQRIEEHEQEIKCINGLIECGISPIHMHWTLHYLEYHLKELKLMEEINRKELLNDLVGRT